MRFRSTLALLGPLPRFSPDMIRKERSQCRASCDTAARRGGPIHRTFIEALPAGWRADPNVEIFSQMLWVRPGWRSTSLGYHLDWRATPEAPGRVETLMAGFGERCCTEFVDDTFELPDHPKARHRWSQLVEGRVARGELKTTRMSGHVMARFDNASWHRAIPTCAGGWRLLVRAIRGLDPARRAETLAITRGAHWPPPREMRCAPHP